MIDVSISFQNLDWKKIKRMILRYSSRSFIIKSNLLNERIKNRLLVIPTAIFNETQTAEISEFTLHDLSISKSFSNECQQPHIVSPKGSGTLKDVCAKFYTSFELNFIYMVSVVVVQAFILCHTNAKVLVST